MANFTPAFCAALIISSVLCATTPGQADPLPKDGRFNLRCSFSTNTVSGPPAPATGIANFAVNLNSQRWCFPDEDCAKRYKLRKLGGSIIVLVVRDSFAEHENTMINLETGALAGSSDDAPGGLINGFRTYLTEGQCSFLPYMERTRP